jgi:hypothetical protein
MAHVGQVVTEGLRSHDVLGLAGGLWTVFELDSFAIVAIVFLSVRVGENFVAIQACELLSVEAIHGKPAYFLGCDVVQFAVGAARRLFQPFIHA